MKICIKCINFTNKGLVKIPFISPSVTKQQLNLLYQPTHGKTMRPRGPTFGFMFPHTIGGDKNTKLVLSVVEMFELKDLAT